MAKAKTTTKFNLEDGIQFRMRAPTAYEIVSQPFPTLRHKDLVNALECLSYLGDPAFKNLVPVLRAYGFGEGQMKLKLKTILRRIRENRPNGPHRLRGP